MASTFSTSLRLTLQATGENSGAWGTITNVNLGTLLEQAICGVTSVAMTDADYTLTASNGVSDQARNAALTMTGSLSVTRSVIIPNVQKTYSIQNSTTGSQTITVKTAAGNSVAIPNGSTCILTCNGAGVVTQRTPTYNPTTNAVSGTVAVSGADFTGAVTFAVNPTVTGNAVWHAGNFNPASYAPVIGFTPVQQGTGIGQSANVVKLGWSVGARLKATIDVTDLGNIATDTTVAANITAALASYLPKSGGSMTGALSVGSNLSVAGTSGLQAITGTTCTLSSVLTCLSPRGAGTGRAIVDSGGAFGRWAWNNGAGYIDIDVNGVAAGITVFTSDVSKKDDITPARDPALPLLRQIRFIDYRYKPSAFGAPPETVMPLQRGGVSAQQLRTIREEWVQELPDGTLQPNVLLLLTNAMQAIQEQDARLSALSAEVEALRSQH